jgi:lysophospholipase L1-like esterase
MAVVGLSACAVVAWSGRDDHEQRSGVTVSVIGDSITFLSSRQITAALTGAGYRSQVVGRIGHTAAEVHRDVEAQARAEPDVVVFELGTNDVTRGTAFATFARTMTTYRDAFPRSCVLATTVSAHRESARLDRTARAVNEWLGHHFARLVDWNSREFAERQRGDDLVPFDDVHPNAGGQALLAQLDLAAVRACRAPPS